MTLQLLTRALAPSPASQNVPLARGCRASPSLIDSDSATWRAARHPAERAAVDSAPDPDSHRTAVQAAQKQLLVLISALATRPAPAALLVSPRSPLAQFSASSSGPSQRRNHGRLLRRDPRKHRRLDQVRLPRRSRAPPLSTRCLQVPALLTSFDARSGSSTCSGSLRHPWLRLALSTCRQKVRVPMTLCLNLVGLADLAVLSAPTPSTGYDCFNIVSPSAVWYLDCTGSGNETISHLREPGNGRLTISASAPTCVSAAPTLLLAHSVSVMLTLLTRARTQCSAPSPVRRGSSASSAKAASSSATRPTLTRCSRLATLVACRAHERSYGSTSIAWGPRAGTACRSTSSRASGALTSLLPSFPPHTSISCSRGARTGLH